MVTNKSLPPFVTGKTQWVLTFTLTPLFAPPLITTPLVQLSWFEAPPDKLNYDNKHTIKYDIKCTLPQFSEYCKDLGSLTFTFINRNKIVGSFEVDVILRNLTKKVEIINNKKVVGTCILNTKYDMVKSNIPIVVRNTNVDRNIDLGLQKTNVVRNDNPDDSPQNSLENASLYSVNNVQNSYLVETNNHQTQVKKNELLKSLNSSSGEKLEKRDLLKSLNSSFDKNSFAAELSEPEENEKSIDVLLLPSSQIINDLDSSSKCSDSIASFDSDSDLEKFGVFSSNARNLAKTKNDKVKPREVDPKMFTNDSNNSKKDRTLIKLKDSRAIIEELENRARKLQTAINLSIENTSNLKIQEYESDDDDDASLYSLGSLDEFDDNDLDFLEVLNPVNLAQVLENVPPVDDSVTAKMAKLDKNIIQSTIYESTINLPSESKTQSKESFLSEEIKERLMKVTGMTSSATSFELFPQAVHPTTIWIEYTIPNESPIRFREKISPSKKHHTMNHSKHTTLLTSPHLWEHEFMNVTVIGLGSMKKGKLNELWNLKGQIPLKELLTINKVTEQVQLFDSTSKKKNFDPLSILAILTMTLNLESIRKEAYYFYFDILDIRLSQPECYIYMCYRLFGKSQTTIPVKYSPEFDLQTGIIQKCSMNYQKTTPIIITNEFYNLYGDFFIIVEVRNTDGLIGLVRLPFCELIQCFKNTEAVVKMEGEYAIVDPFSGNCVGWVKSKMAIGSWEDVKELSAPSKVEVEAIVEEDIHDEVLDDDEKDASADVLVLEDDNFVEKESEEVEQEKSKFLSESIIEITIHRACGLYGLLEQVINLPQNAPYYDILDYASQTGLNTFIKFDLFPKNSTIQTPVIKYSFTPIYNHKVELTIEHDSDLISWIKNSGKAKGEIYHSSNGISIMLSSFELSLDDLLSTGISEWIRVGNSSLELSIKLIDDDLDGCIFQSQDYMVDLSVELNYHSSLKILWGAKDSLIFDDIVDVNNGLLEYHSVEKVVFGTEKIEVLEVQLFDDAYLGSCFVKVANCLRSARALRRSRNSNSLPVIDDFFQIINPHSVDLGGLEAKIRVEVNMVKDSFRRASFGRSQKEELLKAQKDTKDLLNSIELIEIGNESYVKKDSELKLTELTDAHETAKSPKCHENFSNAITFDSMAPTAQKDVSLTNIIADSHVNDQEKDLIVYPIEMKKDTENVDTMIPIYVYIEKALHLPLVNDPLANSMKSPFVKQTVLKTTPPTSSVSFTPPPQFEQKTYNSPSVTSTSPNYNFQTTLLVAKNETTLTELKTADIVFNVWDVEAKVLIGTSLVGLGPLFSMEFIHGWYTVKDLEGFSKGQLMVKILPVEPLGKALGKFRYLFSDCLFGRERNLDYQQEIAGSEKIKSDFQSKIKSGALRDQIDSNIDFDQERKKINADFDMQRETTGAFALKDESRQEAQFKSKISNDYILDGPIGNSNEIRSSEKHILEANRFKSKLSVSINCSDANNVQISKETLGDTFVWNGKDWEHREAHDLEPPSQLEEKENYLPIESKISDNRNTDYERLLSETEDIESNVLKVNNFSEKIGETFVWNGKDWEHRETITGCKSDFDPIFGSLKKKSIPTVENDTIIFKSKLKSGAISKEVESVSKEFENDLKEENAFLNDSKDSRAYTDSGNEAVAELEELNDAELGDDQQLFLEDRAEEPMKDSKTKDYSIHLGSDHDRDNEGDNPFLDKISDSFQENKENEPYYDETTSEQNSTSSSKFRYSADSNPFDTTVESIEVFFFNKVKASSGKPPLAPEIRIGMKEFQKIKKEKSKANVEVDPNVDYQRFNDIFYK